MRALKIPGCLIRHLEMATAERRDHCNSTELVSLIETLVNITEKQELLFLKTNNKSTQFWQIIRLKLELDH